MRRLLKLFGVSNSDVHEFRAVSMIGNVADDVDYHFMLWMMRLRDVREVRRDLLAFNGFSTPEFCEAIGLVGRPVVT